MADILERKIPYLFPGDLGLRLDAQNFVTAISGYPVGGGGGTIVESDFIWKPVINQDGTIGWERDTSATIPATTNLVPHIYNNYWYIGTSNTNVEARGPQGEQGEQGIQGETGPAGADGSNGADGKTPELRINPSNAEWQWKYTVDNDWINLGVTASGAVGPQGQSGASGASGISPTVTTAAIPGEDGTRVTFTYGPGDDSTYIDVMNGAAGASGESGYSPTITTATTADVQHPQGGVNVTVTDIDGNKSFNIWNGIDGQGATVNLLEGDGIQITHNGTDYTIGISADYALKSELPDVSDMATETWVGNQGFLKNSDLTDYATKVYVETASANAYNEAVAQIPDVTDFITKDADDLTYYYKKTETSAKEELSAEFVNKVNKPNTSLTDKYLVLRTDINGAVSGWCDYNDKIYSKSESDLRYMQKTTDNTLSGNGTTNNPLGLDMTNAYTIDGINGITAVPDATSNKVIVKMTDDAWGYYQHLAASASEWDKISGLSAKSNVNITSAGVTTVTNTSGTTENKFTQYAEVANHPTPRMFLCATADTVEDITGVLTAASGMGAIVFVIESHS